MAPEPGAKPLRQASIVTRFGAASTPPAGKEAVTNSGGPGARRGADRRDAGVLQAGEEDHRDRGPDEREEHVRLGVPRIALRAEELVGALPERQRRPPLD